MFNNLSSLSRNKSSVFLLVLALIVGGVGAQATGLLNTRSGGYFVCVNSTTKVVTHPGTSSCPKGSKKLVLGAQGVAGASGLTGATGLSGRDGRNGTDGKTLWNGTADPVSRWGAPGDMFINSVTKTLFGPKNIDGTWPAGVSMVGPKGDQGLTGLTGAQGPGGASGGSGPAGATGAQGPIGLTGVAAPVVTGDDCIGTKCTYKIGDTGPGGGIIFFVDYFDQYVGFNYLEAAPTDGVFVASAASAASGVWATTVAKCGAGSDEPCQSGSIYTETGTALATIKWLHRGLGGGLAATAAIILKHVGEPVKTYAASVAREYTTPSCDGVTCFYYLPTKDEIELMQKNLNNFGVGGFVVDFYWSSSEVNTTNAWRQSFDFGSQGNVGKKATAYVRPVRRF